MKRLLLFTLVIVVASLVHAEENAVSQSHKRTLRSIRRYRPRDQVIDPKKHPLCMANGVTGACLPQYVCEAEKGVFMGDCGSDGICCNVVKSCGATTDSPAVLFQNKMFPKNETGGSFCSITIKINEGICALRMEQQVFELYRFRKDYCPFDSFTVLGTKKLSSVLCGNMTGWSTTFEVEPLSEISVAAVVQGSSRFSVLFTMLACNQIVALESPPNAGIHNLDAEEYTTTTTTTTTTPKPTTTPETVSRTDPGGEGDEETTTSFTPPERGAPKPSSPTPLPVGTIPTKPTEPSVIARQPLGEDNSEGIVNDYIDPTPDSILKRVFEDRVSSVFEKRWWDDSCRRSIDIPQERKVQGVTNPEALIRSHLVDKCWFYDPNLSSYAVNEECMKQLLKDSEDGGFRIIGGKNTNLNEYPWQVALIYKSKMFCGGSLISSRFVITASHCLFASFSKGIHLLKVTLGDHDLKTKNDTKNVLVGVKRVIWNIHYNSDTTENDIGLLELMEPVEFSYSILPINLPTDLSYNYAGQNATVTGWGRMDFRSKKKSVILKKYRGLIDDIDVCVKRWKKYPTISAIKDIHICLNVTLGSPCHGDSGGPLVTCNSGRCTLTGIVSFGFPLCRNVGLPAVFSKITAYKRWIDINTSQGIYYHI